MDDELERRVMGIALEQKNSARAIEDTRVNMLRFSDQVTASLDKVQESLGRLSETSAKRDLAVIELTVRVSTLAERMEKDVLPQISEFRRIRATGGGILLAVGAFSSFLGFFIGPRISAWFERL